ncbi:MAG: hypothetical protein LBT57_00020 [Puniceicoccales bacterium]|nr:hypothetical protein [Puniceicoccales bacterium]
MKNFKGQSWIACTIPRARALNVGKIDCSPKGGDPPKYRMGARLADPLPMGKPENHDGLGAEEDENVPV